MAAVVRTFLICLLVLAVSAQGAAAATIVFCGPNHHGDGAARTEVSATAAEHAHHGGAVAADEIAGAATSGLGAANDESAIVKAGQAAKQKCSACASCCSPGAILARVPVVAATNPAPTVFMTAVPTVNAFAVGGPDRPPRNVRA